MSEEDKVLVWEFIDLKSGKIRYQLPSGEILEKVGDNYKTFDIWNNPMPEVAPLPNSIDEKET